MLYTSLQLLADHLGIDLGGGDIGVAQHLLNGVEVCAVFQQMGGKGMAERVGGDVLLDARLLLVVLDDLQNPWRLIRSRSC